MSEFRDLPFGLSFFIWVLEEGTQGVFVSFVLAENVLGFLLAILKFLFLQIVCEVGLELCKSSSLQKGCCVHNSFPVCLKVHLVEALISSDLRQIGLELSCGSIVRGRGIEFDVVPDRRNWGVDDVGGGPKGFDFFLELFHFFILLGLACDEASKPVYFADQLLELLRSHSGVIAAVVTVGHVQFLLEVALRGVVSESRHREGFCV